MAEASGEYAGSVIDDEDIRGESKKRRFKPLSAMRKFFGLKRKNQESVVAVKTQSTMALQSRDEEDEDDGGFKSHQKPRSLVGNRSKSEDSVFVPDTKETTPSPFPKSAISEESLPKSAFQSELFSKLHKRRSNYSDDDHDDGLPKSPIPPVTTADIIMGDPLKTVQSGKKSSSRDSDQSLISLDTSDLEDDLFSSKWKSSVPTKKLGPRSPKTSDSAMDSLDFSKIQKTEVLISNAAKDRIMIKPSKRKASRQSRKTRDPSVQQSLPCLNEESPTRVQPEEVKDSWISGSPVTKSPVKPNFTKSEETLAPSTLSLVRAPGMSTDRKTGEQTQSGGGPKPAKSSINISSSRGNKSLLASPPSTVAAASPPPTVTMTVVATAASSTPPKATTPTSPTVKLPSHKSGSTSSSTPASPPPPQTPPAVAILAEKKVIEGPPPPDVNQQKIAPASSATVSATVPTQNLQGADEKPNVDIKSRMNNLQKSSSSGIKSGPTSNIDTEANISANEDLKYRHQTRAKTMPEQQTSPKIQRSGSRRVRSSTSTSPEQNEEAVSPSGDKNVLSLASATTVIPANVLSGAKKLDTNRLSFTQGLSSTSEPAWKNSIRKKDEEQTNVSNSDNTKAASVVAEKTATTVAKVGLISKPMYTSANNLDKKRGSIETISFKNRELSDEASKKMDTAVSDTKRQSIDMGSSKRPSIDITSTRRDSVEHTLEQGSVKALQRSFDLSKLETSYKFASHKDISKSSVPPTTVSSSSLDKSKSSSSSSSVKVASESGSGAGESKTTSVGISHSRSGSVKTSPVKSNEVKGAFHGRRGSVKVTSSFIKPDPETITTTASSPLTKADSVATAAAVKSDCAGLPSSSSSSSTSTTSSAPASVHAANSNPSLPSIATVVTTSVPSFSSSAVYSGVKPYSAYSSKVTSLASAPNPVNSVTPPNSKASSTTTSSSSTAASFGVKAASGAGVKTVTLSQAKSVVSASPAISMPVSTAATTVPSSSSSSSSSSVTSGALSRSSSVRSHASFSASTSSRPQISNTSPTSSRNTAITKSPSFKSTVTTEKKSAEKLAVVFEKSPTGVAGGENKFVEKSAVIEKSPVVTATTSSSSSSSTTTEKRPESNVKVPAWRANVQKDVKIEIIENSPSSSSSSSSTSKSDLLRKGTDKKADTSGGGTNIQADKSSNRSSKVLDMVKNFQNLQVTS